MTELARLAAKGGNVEDDGAASGAGRVGIPRELSTQRPQILMTTKKPPGDSKPGEVRIYVASPKP